MQTVLINPQFDNTLHALHEGQIARHVGIAGVHVLQMGKRTNHGRNGRIVGIVLHVQILKIGKFGKGCRIELTGKVGQRTIKLEQIRQLGNDCWNTLGGIHGRVLEIQVFYQ